MTKAATKLKNAAQSTARCGDITRVETTVAIELAASWKPFRKSKTSAIRMMTTTVVSMFKGGRSGVLDDDVAEDVRVVLARVASVFEALVDLAPLQDVDGVLGVVFEEV